MWNNHEFRLFTYYYVSCSILAYFLYTFVWQSVLVWFFTASVSYFLYWQYNLKRFQQINQLSKYLQQIYQGLESFDIQMYCEGDLSILKSDLYKITHVLKEQKERLRKDKQFLADTLSDISHQIKTPLTSMLVVSDLFDEDLPLCKRKEFISLFQSQLKRMEWLVSSLLKMSKIDANAIPFHKEPHALKLLLEKSVKAFQIQLELHKQSLQLICEEGIIIKADSHWILEAFSNILKNGIEHTEENGWIHIYVKDTPTHTQIHFMDNGCGIAEEDLPHIFERFYKGKDASSDSVGIGLALSKSILIQHNANISVESQIGKGTTFIISFYK